MTPNPQAELAEAIHRKTSGGDTVVDFLTDVLDQNVPDVQLTHRLQSARLLTRYGHFPKAQLLLDQHKLTRKPGMSRRERKQQSEFDDALQKIILAEAGPAFTAQWLIDVMQGRTPAIDVGLDTFKPHHRMRAVREILARGYDKDYTSIPQAQTQTSAPGSSATPVAAPAPGSTATPAATVIPAKAGIQSAPQLATPQNHTDTEPTTQNSELIADDSELTTNDSIEYDPEKDPLIIKMDEVFASMDLSEFEEDPPSPYKPDLSMWDIIAQLPEDPGPHPEIGAAKLEAMIERRERSRAAGILIPQRNSTKDDHINYDDS